MARRWFTNESPGKKKLTLSDTEAKTSSRKGMRQGEKIGSQKRIGERSRLSKPRGAVTIYVDNSDSVPKRGIEKRG